MISTRTRLPLLAVLILCLMAGDLRADFFVFRNDCKVPLIVQVATVRRGVLMRDQALLRAGEATLKTPLESDKVITIVDSRTSRIIFRNVLKVRKKPAYFSLAPDPIFPTRLRITEIPPLPEPPPKR